MALETLVVDADLGLHPESLRKKMAADILRVHSEDFSLNQGMSSLPTSNGF